MKPKIEDIEVIEIRMNSMRQRNILDRFAKKCEKELTVIPKYIDGNFMRLYYWVRDKKEFNKNNKKIKTKFWNDFEKLCKRNRIDYKRFPYKK